MRRWQVVGVGMLAVIQAGCSGGTLESLDAPKPSRATSDADVEIFMSVAATEPQLAAVTRALRRSDQVVRFRVMTREDAYREFTRLFKSQPALVASTSPEALPASVRVTLAKGAVLRRFADAAGKLPGVDEVKYSEPSGDVSRVIKEFCRENPPASPRADSEVFMNVGATPSQVSGVRRRLRASAVVKSFSFVSQAAASRRFRRLFADQPDIDAGAAVSVALPASFRVQLYDRGKRRKLAREVGDLPGVTGVSETGQLDALCR